MAEKTFERTPKDLIIGIAMTLCGGVLWGVNATVSKILMGTYHASPLWIACVRELAAGVLFLTCSAIMTPKLLTGALRDRKSYPRLLATAIICVLLVQVAYLESINWTNSGTATVLQSLNLLFVLGVVCLRGRRLPGVREGIGVALAFAGTVLIATGGDFTTLKLPLVGLIWGAINAASTAAMVFLPVKLIERWGNFTVNGIAFLISGLVLLPFVRPWATAPQLDWLGVGLMAFTVIGGTFGAFWLYMAGVVRVGSMRATMLGTSEPVMATISAVAWTDAVFEPTDLVGFVMILIMVFWCVKCRDGRCFSGGGVQTNKKPDTHLLASGFALLSDYRDLRRANMTYGSWKSAFNRNLMLGLNLLLRFGLRHFQAQGAVLVAGVNVGILHVLANVEATRARAGVAFATQPAAVVVLVLVRAVAMRGNGQIAVLQVQRNVVLLEARHVDVDHVALVGLTHIGAHHACGHVRIACGCAVHVAPTLEERIVEQIGKHRVIHQSRKHCHNRYSLSKCAFCARSNAAWQPAVRLSLRRHHPARPATGFVAASGTLPGS